MKRKNVGLIIAMGLATIVAALSFAPLNATGGRRTDYNLDFNVIHGRRYNSISVSPRFERTTDEVNEFGPEGHIATNINAKVYAIVDGEKHKLYEGPAWTKNSRTRDVIVAIPNLEVLLGELDIFRVYAQHPESLDTPMSTIDEHFRNVPIEIVYTLDPANYLSETDEYDNRINLVLSPEDLETLHSQFRVLLYSRAQRKRAESEKVWGK